MDGLRLVYVTAPDTAQALAIGRVLVADGLAACINVLPNMTAIYRWQGAIEESCEAVLIAKTRADQVDGLIARVRSLHPAQVPCVLVLPIVGGHPDYLAWLARESG